MRGHFKTFPHFFLQSPLSFEALPIYEFSMRPPFPTHFAEWSEKRRLVDGEARQASPVPPRYHLRISTAQRVVGELREMEIGNAPRLDWLILTRGSGTSKSVSGWR